MPLRLRVLSCYRPRLLSVLLLFIIATLLVLANLSDEIRPRHKEAWLPPPRFDVRERDDQARVNFHAGVFNVSYGWPLLWRQYIFHRGMGVYVSGEHFSPSRLAGNIALWVAMLTSPAAVCKWLLRRYRPRPR